MSQKIRIYADAAVIIVKFLIQELNRATREKIVKTQARLFGSTPQDGRQRNIVVIGASFAGHHVAKMIASSLPAKSDYRVVVIEPNSHFHFTWVLPRFCVAKGHEHKAFIPYGKYISAPDGALQWIRDRVAGITEKTVLLQDSGDEIAYDYLVIATGAAVEGGLPSRVNHTEKIDGVKALQEFQNKIEAASSVVVVGGGAAGVELATDAKSLYPEKNVTLVHSRSAVMNRFGETLQTAAREGLEKLGVDLILEDRVVGNSIEHATVELQSGRTIPCDYLINCAGQQPNSHILSTLSKEAISSSGYIKVLPTLQIADLSYPNIYACGDVAETNVPTPNARSARQQAVIVAENVLRAAKGKSPTHIYKHNWLDGFIKLTLGLDRSVTYLGNQKRDLLFRSEEKEVALMVGQCWTALGQKPYEDDSFDSKSEQKLDA